MNQTSTRISTNSKNEQTPRFGIQTSDRISTDVKNNEDTKMVQSYQRDGNWPQTILQQSSNSQQCMEYKLIIWNDQNRMKEIQLVYEKEEQYQYQKPKRYKTEKYKNQVNVVNSLTDKHSKYQISEAQYQKVTSSLGIPTNLQISRKKTFLNEKQAEEDCKIYKNGSWNRTKLMLTQSQLSFFQFSFEIKDLQKIKIVPSTNSSKTKPENIIKIVVNRQVNLFSLSLDKKSYQVPTSYYIFSKLIQKKMFQNRLLGLPQWQKSQHIQKRATEDSYIYGNIFKKSQHFGKWENRFVVIKKNGIYSYKDSKQQQNYSFYVSRESIKYLWTRFQKIDDYLIIKIKHGIYKTQFGIPFTQFSTRSSSNWLYSFYRVLPMMTTVSLSPTK